MFLCENLSYLQFLECEASASSCFTVVLDGGTSDDGAQLVNWTGSNTSDFGETVGSAARLATWLFEMDLDATLPVLVEVGVGDDVVVLDRLRFLLVAAHEY